MTASWAAEHPRGALIALSFLLMPVVLGIEWLEETSAGAGWAAGHRPAVALVKQALCMSTIPGLIMLMWGKEISRWTRREKLLAFGAGLLIVLGVTWSIVFR